MTSLAPIKYTGPGGLDFAICKARRVNCGTFAPNLIFHQSPSSEVLYLVVILDITSDNSSLIMNTEINIPSKTGGGDLTPAGTE